MPLRCEVVRPGAEPADREEGGADDDMEAVEARRQEENRRINAAAVELERCMRIFQRLAAGEQRAQNDGQPEAAQQVAAVAFQQRVMRPGDRGAGQQQNHRVQQRQMERVEGKDVGWRPYRLPVALDFGEQQEVEIGPEEADEKHHLRRDEQQHAVAQAELHDLAVQAGGAAFLNDIAPPAGHGGNDRERADDQHEIVMVVCGDDDPEQRQEPT